MMIDQRFSATTVYYPASYNSIYFNSYTQLPLKVIGIQIQMCVGILSLRGGLKYCWINLKQSRSISGESTLLVSDVVCHNIPISIVSIKYASFKMDNHE